MTLFKVHCHHCAASRRFQWTYVTCVHDDTSYGERGYQEIFKLAQEEKSCIAEAMKVKQ
ncbi:hypothetical protein DPMN_157814 [Dreissena polymorpha]|uniref:Uncharacterized protein n=1 Tax=Dreissena polymorpha TaxID=45954 RepID=A0A9D4IML8_DREPO|nr:hypothetical protein DPMN_157814 [Dreissena polymorpha]